MYQLSSPSPLGLLHTTADESGITSLGFCDHPLPPSVHSPHLEHLQEELAAYFAGTLQTFSVPLSLDLGTSFQREVWKTLQTIPYGETWSYGELATAIGRPTAFRAVANANGKNPLPLLIPCHRVIRTGGHLGGYSCGIERKAWLLNHEETHR